MKVNNWKNTTEQLRYCKLCLASSEVADLAAPINHEYKCVKNWIDKKLKRLQLSEGQMKTNEIPKTHETGEKEKKDEDDGCENILDPLTKTYKGQSRKNKIKPANR